MWGRQIAQPEPLPSCGAEPVGRPHVPLPLAEVTLGLRNTPIRITTIPSSVSSICNISSVSSNVTKVSAQGFYGAVPHLAIAWQFQGLGWGPGTKECRQHGPEALSGFGCCFCFGRVFFHQETLDFV